MISLHMFNTTMYYKVTSATFCKALTTISLSFSPFSPTVDPSTYANNHVVVEAVKGELRYYALV